MRIVAGKYKGRNLLSFEGEKIRPTSDKARESLFNILQFEIVGKTFLDLFAGTGAVGFEALSRGASKVYLIDYAKDSIVLINKNKQKLGIGQEAVVEFIDALEFLKRTKEKFDIIFIDPPYKEGYYEKVIPLLAEVTNEQSLIVLESETLLEINSEDFKVVDQRKYGRTKFTFIKKV